MPLQITEAISPGGLRHVQIDLEGWIDLDDGLAIEAWVLPGQPHHLGYLLPRAAKGTEYSPEVRKLLATLNDKCTAVAMVVTSPLVRAAVNLMMRYAGDQGDLLRMFTSETEAVAWLEKRALESRTA
jgi:hypothetical protein